MTARGYQHEFSRSAATMYDVAMRERKARTMVAVLADHFGGELSALAALDVGSSTGIIDHYLASFLGSVTGIDIDSEAVRHAVQTYSKDNLKFQPGDAMNLPFADRSFDVVICSQVYEHVPDAARMMDEILRVLRTGGVCYFAATNRLKLMEEHYHLPLLSVLPKWAAHIYLRMAGKGDFYYERHFSYWGLRTLTKNFDRVDYTSRTLADPLRFGIDYMIRPGSLKARLAGTLLRYFYWMSPGYIWLLRKR